MKHVGLADAKARFSELVDEVEHGQSVAITRRGKVVAKLTPVFEPKKPVDIDRLRALTDSMPMQEEDAGTFVRRMRDEERY